MTASCSSSPSASTRRLATAAAADEHRRSGRSTFTSNGVRCAAWHLPGTADDVHRRRRPPLCRHGTRFRRHSRHRPSCVRGGVRRRGARCRRVRLSRVRRLGRDAAAAGLVPAPASGLSRGDRCGARARRRRPRPDRPVGHVVLRRPRLPVAVADGRIAAIVAMTPAMDGLAALLAIARHGGPRRLAPLVAHGVRDVLRVAASPRAPPPRRSSARPARPP